ncbi:GNAT family N-acetyltransferase [Limosilactobacillus kribbianus]|uniref:GNAT family N-acetyltransferase n=1 Tax=Limosilactobacillus kribbianus TaxID=2982695 RepID=UPI00226441CE|nr:GNAT family N-acetyltransferase [Limosilactobacillus kribbianus]
MKLERAATADIHELYQLQLLAFESEAEMIGSRDVPALQETEAESAADFTNWIVLKLVSNNRIIGAIRYRTRGKKVEVGRVMVHPGYRRRGLAQRLLKTINEKYPDQVRELYTCTKSWKNIALYKKMGYHPVKEVTEDSGLSFVYMQKK